MKGLAAVCTLAITIGFSGYCLAADPEKVTHEQAAKEALENRSLANELWIKTHQACAAKDKAKMFEIMRRISAQQVEKPTNHLNYSARSMYSSCQQMFLDVSFINGACLSKSPTKHEIDYINESWRKDSESCDSEIEQPIHSTEAVSEQTEADWESELKKEGVSKDDIEFMREVRRS